MFLNTLSYDLHYIKNYGHSYYNSTFIIGSQGMAQTNTNLGSRIIIPDASIGEASVFAELNHYLRDLQFNAGLRYDFRDIKTLNTDGINYDAHIQPFNKIWNVFNGSVGLNLEILKLLHIYADANTGFRSPNLAELSSNGLHEGTYRWEIGNPDMKAEQNIGTDMGMIITSEWVSLKLGAYKNHIYNFIQTVNHLINLFPPSSNVTGVRYCAAAW